LREQNTKYAVSITELTIKNEESQKKVIYYERLDLEIKSSNHDDNAQRIEALTITNESLKE